MKKIPLLDYYYEELVQYLESTGHKSFRATQIFEWIYKKGVTSFDGMKNLPKDLRSELEKRFVLDVGPLQCNVPAVAADGTIKYLFQLQDGENIETVLIPAKKRNTVCVSTQVGCKFSCKFCASGIGGFKRNLTTAEILSQILLINNYVGTLQYDVPRITHIVFMGIGEPLDNYDNLLKAIRTINSPEGMNIAARRITISTCGLIPQMHRFSQEGLQIELAISLHGSNNATRNALMPVNKKYPLNKLMEACKLYCQTTKRQITFEYLLIRDLTCSLKNAQELKSLLGGILCKMNLIVYNEVADFPYKAPQRKDVLEFKSQLQKLGIHATIRLPRGKDVAAACGQLRYGFRA